MLRTVRAILIVFLVVGCESETETDESTAASANFEINAAIEYQGNTYDLVVLDDADCGTRPDGTFGTWAFTLDATGEVDPKAPHLHALSKGNWSVIDFYPAIDDQIVRIYRDGPEKFSFVNGVLEFEGELGAGLREKAKVKVTCPQ